MIQAITGRQTITGRQPNFMYAFGGGTIGGNIWNYRQPTTIERMAGITRPIPELKRAYTGGATSALDFMSGAAARRKIDVVPAGTGARQEFWNSPEGRRIKQRGRYVEAPELFERGMGTSQQDRIEQLYSTVTGRPMGTLMGTGGYGGFGPATQTSQRSWSNYTGDMPIERHKFGGFYRDSPSWRQGGTGIPERSGPRNPEYGSNPEKIAKAMAQREMEEEDVMGYAGSPMAFTPFGSAIGMLPSLTATSTLPPFPTMPDYSSLTGFGGYLTFPYANY